MVRIRNADFGVSPNASFMRDHETHNAGEVGLERQRLQIHHQLGISLERDGNGVGPVERRQLARRLLFRNLNSALYVADRVEILSKLGSVVRTEPAFKG